MNEKSEQNAAAVSESVAVVAKYTTFIRNITVRLWLNTAAACVMVAISLWCGASLIIESTETQEMLCIMLFVLFGFASLSIISYVLCLHSIKKTAQHTLEMQKSAQCLTESIT